MVQTSMEWFVEQLPIRIVNMYNKEIIQAKQMEKEQLVKAWDDGDYAYFYSKETGRDFDNGEEYYNEIYEKQ
jgi:curli biogenesis system outer membrane secretion channel CsgG